MHDERMRELIPSIIESISGFFVPILNTMYAIQSDLYQHLYASVYEYATDQGLSNTDYIVEELSALFDPIRERAETEVKSLREGKIARTPYGESNGKSGLFGRKSSGSLPVNRPSTKSAPPPPPPPAYTPQLEPRKSSLSTQKVPPPPPSSGPSLLTPEPRRSFGGSRTPSSSSISSEAAKKKKPPPPPPPKPSISPKPEFVTAKYDFGGESQGDLAFRTGDRIKIIKKTNNLEDWWEGELNGSRGMFPRNYCE
jgi:amphiphysin